MTLYNAQPGPPDSGRKPPRQPDPRQLDQRWHDAPPDGRPVPPIQPGQPGSSYPTGTPRPTGQQPAHNGYGPTAQLSHNPVPPPGSRPERRGGALTGKQRYWIIGGLTAFAALAFVGMIGLLLLVYIAQPRIPTGVRVAGIEVGGETVRAASEVLETAYAAQVLRLTDGDRAWTVRLTDLGIALDAETTLAAAEAAPVNAIVPPVYTIDFPQTQAKLINLSAEINIPAVNGNPPSDGRSLDIPFVLDRLRLNLNTEITDGVLDLSMIEVKGTYDATADYTGIPVQHTVAAGEELGLIAKNYNVALNDLVQLNNIENPDLLYVGQVLTIPAAGVYEPTQDEAPPAPLATGKSIVISTENQRIYAYENGLLVHSHLVSTGLPATPTVKGDYKVYIKLAADDMSGPDYFLPQVPYTMYFYQGYAIHGTYWHNNFGRPMSHGCVNLPTDEAQWFFNWAEVGTTVRVI